MGALDVLHLIRESGLTVTADGDRLIVNPSVRLTDDLRTLVRNNKSVVLDALESESAELTRLVQVCAERYGFTEVEHAEALAVALADPVDALTCFRTMAAKPYPPLVIANATAEKYGSIRTATNPLNGTRS